MFWGAIAAISSASVDTGPVHSVVVRKKNVLALVAHVPRAAESVGSHDTWRNKIVNVSIY